MFIIILLFCSALFIGTGIYAMCKKTPMWFWAGTENEMYHKKIHDVQGFNKKNGWMWIIFGTTFLFPIILRLCNIFPEWILGIFIIFLCVVGTVIMMLYWEHIHETYTK